MRENVQSSESTIRDADKAKEMTEYMKYNLWSQSAQAMLAQENLNVILLQDGRGFLSDFFLVQKVAHMFIAPITHCRDYRNQRSAEIRQAVFGFERHNGINFAVNNAVTFQFAELLSQNFVRGLRDKPPNFAET